jgi:hypothetical protein
LTKNLTSTVFDDQKTGPNALADWKSTKKKGRAETKWRLPGQPPKLTFWPNLGRNRQASMLIVHELFGSTN